MPRRQSRKFAKTLLDGTLFFICRRGYGVFVSCGNNFFAKLKIRRQLRRGLESFLNVPAAMIPEKVLACYSSAFSDRAKEYRKINGLDGEIRPSDHPEYIGLFNDESGYHSYRV